MRKNLLLVTVALLVSGSAGCASSSLKESNRRLKESNDRLIAENTRLEQDMQRLQQELAGGGQVRRRRSKRHSRNWRRISTTTFSWTAWILRSRLIARRTGFACVSPTAFFSRLDKQS